MKKCVLLALVLVLCLSGCRTNSARGTDSAVPESSVSSAFPGGNSVGGRSDIDTEVSTTCIDEPLYFPFTCESVEDFVKWTKVGGTVSIGQSGNPDNPLSQRYLKWSKTADSLVVPEIKNNNYHLNWIQVMEEENGYYMQIYANKEYVNTPIHNEFDISIYALTKEQEKHNIDQVTEWFSNIRFGRPIQNFPVNKGTCKWGEYRFINANGTSTASRAWFIYDSFLVVISARQGGYEYRNCQTGDWNEKYFDYFDFKTVSLP